MLSTISGWRQYRLEIFASQVTFSRRTPPLTPGGITPGVVWAQFWNCPHLDGIESANILVLILVVAIPIKVTVFTVFNVQRTDISSKEENWKEDLHRFLNLEMCIV